jgi:hypothetical protein
MDRNKPIAVGEYLFDLARTGTSEYTQGVVDPEARFTSLQFFAPQTVRRGRRQF